VSETAPPGERTPTWQPMTEAARQGVFKLQICNSCYTVQYPPREVCMQCLGGGLEWQRVDAGGTLIAATTLQASVEPYFQARLPLQIGSVKLDCGPVVIAFIDERCRQTGARVRLANRLDDSGQAVPVAEPE